MLVKVTESGPPIVQRSTCFKSLLLNLKVHSVARCHIDARCHKMSQVHSVARCQWCHIEQLMT